MTTRSQLTHSLLSRSPEQTRALGRRLASLLGPGDLICLQGDLGAGKTTLVQGLAEGLGSPRPATSPSFTLHHRYPGRLPLHHLDLYRLQPAELSDLGLEEMFDGDAVVVIEWADRLPAALRRSGVHITIEFDPCGENARRLLLHARGDRAADLLARLRADLLAHPLSPEEPDEDPCH